MKKKKEFRAEIERFLLQEYGKASKEIGDSSLQVKAYDRLCQRYRARLSRQEYGRARLIIEDIIFG
jgi:hypothetical protein